MIITPRNHVRAFLIGLVCTFATGLQAQTIAPTIPKMVFAHYMVCCPRAGHFATVDDFKSEIRAAQQRKIDGFVLNIGEWRRETNYQVVSRRIFEAAEQLMSGFKLIFSFDGLPAADAAAVMTEFGNRPNYFRIAERPVVSTYSGSPRWGKDLFSGLEQNGMKPFLVPNYQYLSEHRWARNHNIPTASFLDELYRDNPILAGYFF